MSDVTPVRFIRVTTAGECAECDDPINPGDMTVLRSDDSYAHETHYRATTTIIRWEHE